MAKLWFIDIAEEMQILAKKHNELVNPSGKAWSRVLTRGHDEVDQGLEEPAPEHATNVQRTQGDPETKGATHCNNRIM